MRSFSEDDDHVFEYNRLKMQKQRAKTEAEEQAIEKQIKALQAQRKAKTGKGWGMSVSFLNNTTWFSKLFSKRSFSFSFIRF